jgi:putative ABC transport system permease protein
MLRLTLRTLSANITRLLLSSLAIVLGVGFIAGGMMFTDGLEKAMTDVATARYRNTDIEVSADRGWPADVADRVRAVPGVRAAEGVATETSFGMATNDGRQVPGYHFATSLPVDPALRVLDPTQGRLPSAPGEIVLDDRFADREKIRVGDEVRLGGNRDTAKPYRLVGLVRATKDPLATGGAFVGMVLSDALAFQGRDLPERVVVAAGDGVSHPDLAARIRAAVGGEVRTHDELVRAALRDVVGNAQTFRTGLLAFGVIAVFVAAFVIANTFTIVLAQRTRETALLRLVGATRRQVFRSVVLEASVTGLVGSLLGLLAGAGLAHGLRAVFAAMGSSLSTDLVITPVTVAASIAVGTGVTTLSALLPARRGTAVAPVAALSDAAVEVARRPGRVRRGFGVLALTAGVAGLAAAALIDQLALVVLGTLVAFVGFLLLSPTVVPVIVGFLGWPAAKLGASASLGLANAVRNPRRIATTTNALVIGVTLVSTFTLLAESAKAPAERKADARLAAHFLVNDGSELSVMPGTLAENVRRQPELRLVHPQFEAADAGPDGAPFEVHAGHPGLLGRRYPDHDGSVAALAPGTAVVTRETGIGVGGTVTVKGRPFRVVGAVPVGHDTTIVARSVWLTADDLTALFPDPYLSEMHVDPAPGISAAAAKAALDRVAREYPTMVVADRAAYVARLNGPIDQGLAVVSGLLALAVIIALIGVANTLTLSVLERTRENALLRAVGLSRGQLRGTLVAEAVVMALAGTVLGIAASVAITTTVLHALKLDGGPLPFVLPWDRLGVLLGVAVIAALAASLFPARRAARRSIVATLAVE